MLIELFERFGKYIDMEEFLKSKGSGFMDDESAKAKRKYEGLDRNWGKKPKQGQSEIARDQIPMTFTPLTQPIQEIMVAAEAYNLLKKWGKMKSLPERRIRDKYCRYHRDYGHDIEDCFWLRIAIGKLIEAGHLAEFVNKNRPARPDV